MLLVLGPLLTLAKGQSPGEGDGKNTVVMMSYVLRREAENSAPLTNHHILRGRRTSLLFFLHSSMHCNMLQHMGAPDRVKQELPDRVQTGPKVPARKFLD